MAEITKNVFSNGMIKDLSPTNTSLTFVTDALNATLMTNNGNETSLLNDMGNTTLPELALPQGYSVVGTTEYGGVIYVLSTNPETNRSQIGSFPSPEYIFNEYGTSSDSTKFTKDIELNPDKFILKGDEIRNIKKYNPDTNKYDDDSKISGDESIKVTSTLKFTEDYTIKPGDSFKIIRNFVSEQGKILNKGTKEDLKVLSYFNEKLVLLKEDGTLTDIDYKVNTDMYTYLSTKLSGKLALRLDLKTIESYSVTWDADEIDNLYKVTFNITYNDYKISDSEANAIYKDTILKLRWEEKDELENIITKTETYICDNGNNRKITLFFDKNFNNKVTFEATPVLQWGLFVQEKRTFEIDFSKINSDSFIFNKWKYYAYDLTCVVTLATELYPKLNYKVDNIELHFYDNLSECAIYTISGMESYSGLFEFSLPLNGSFNISELTAPEKISHLGLCVYYDGGDHGLIRDEKTRLYILVKGEDINSKKLVNVLCDPNIIKIDGEPLKNIDNIENIRLFENNTGIILVNYLYCVKIVVNMIKEDNTSDTQLSKPVYKWLFTNGVNNDYYFDDVYNNFDDITINLIPNVVPKYEVIPGEEPVKLIETSEKSKDENTTNITYENTTTSRINVICDFSEDEVNLHIGFENNYGCFSLTDPNNAYDIKVYLGNTSGIFNDDTLPQLISYDEYDIKTSVENATWSAELTGEKSESPEKIAYTNEADEVFITDYELSNKSCVFTGKITTHGITVMLTRNGINVLKPLFSLDDITKGKLGLSFNGDKLVITDQYRYAALSEYVPKFGTEDNDNSFTSMCEYNGEYVKSIDDIGNRRISCYKRTSEHYNDLTKVTWPAKVIDAKNTKFNNDFTTLSPGSSRTTPKMIWGISLSNYVPEWKGNGHRERTRYEKSEPKMKDNPNDSALGLYHYEEASNYLPAPIYFIAMRDLSGNIHLLNLFVKESEFKDFCSYIGSMLLQIYVKSNIANATILVPRTIFQEEFYKLANFDFIIRVNLNGDTFSHLRFYTMSFEEYCNETIKAAGLETLNKPDIKIRDTSILNRQLLKFKSYAPPYSGSEGNTLVNTNYGTSDVILSDVKSGTYYSYVDGELNSVSPELRFYVLNFEKEGNITAESTILTSSNFDDIFKIDLNRIKLKHSDFDQSYLDYFSVLTEHRINGDTDKNKERRSAPGSWADCREDEILIDGYDYKTKYTGDI